MKKLAVAAAFLVAASANAEEIKFGDLNYLLKTGEYQLSADVNTSVHHYKSGSTTLEEEGFETTARLTAGLMESLNVFVELGYDLAYETTNETAKTTEDTDGLRNPAIGGIYRLVAPVNGGYVVDVGATARVRLQDAKDDNAADPRHSLDLFGRIGRKYNEANEMQLVAGVLHHFDGEQENQDVDSSNDIYVRAAYQWRPVNEFMMATAIQGTRVGEFDVENATADSHLDFDLFFNAKYLITSNFIARFNYQFGRYPDYDFDAGDVSGRRHQKFGLGVDYLF